jgi:FlaA1/EpsC-like NDP-sugar epimerase
VFIVVFSFEEGNAMVNKIDYETITGNPPPTINLEAEDLEFLKGKTVLVTGAGGSIGSRIAIQLARVPGIRLLALDRDENSLHSLSLSISDSALFQDANYVLQDIRDRDGVRNIFQEFRPSLVIHCAALKHLSVLENHPREAVLTNVFGTQNLLENSISFGVVNFLNVSTDKAAAPTSILGKSKRIAELLVIRARKNGHNGFTNVRFGNVFNSKGSVIETFHHQILNGSPITLTDAKMRRYFMHIDEAAALAIKSTVLNEGEIHILDMGQPILMLDIIERLKIALNSDARIELSGTRQGEKLNEDLMNEFETLGKTSHYKIRVLNSDNSGLANVSGLELETNTDALHFIRDLLENDE